MVKPMIQDLFQQGVTFLQNECLILQFSISECYHDSDVCKYEPTKNLISLLLEKLPQNIRTCSLPELQNSWFLHGGFSHSQFWYLLWTT